MFAVPPGLSARYMHDEGTPSEHFTFKKIVAFDDDAYPYVISENTERRLVRAAQYANFDGIVDDPYPPIVAIAPANGYRVEFTDPSNGAKYSSPLVGWALKADGDVIALDVDSDGAINELEYSRTSRQEFRIYHPDAKE